MLYILNLLILLNLNISDKELVGNVLDKLHYYASIADGENYFKLAAIGLPTGSFAGLCGKLHVMMNIYILLFSNPI